MTNSVEKTKNLINVELQRVKEALKVTCAKLMVANQTVHELLKGHMDLRAALTLVQPDKKELEQFINSLLNPPVASVVEEKLEIQNEAPVVDANTVSA